MDSSDRLRSARRMVLYTGSAGAASAASLALVPASWAVVPMFGLGLAGAGFYLALTRLRTAQQSVLLDRLRARWSWMSQPRAISSDLQDCIEQIARLAPLSTGIALAGEGPGARWEWAVMEWEDYRAENAQRQFPPLRIWVMMIDFTDERPLRWGTVRREGGFFPAPRNRAKLALPGVARTVVYAEDTVAVSRAWNPQAAQFLAQASAEPTALVHAQGARGVLMVPAAWIEGKDVLAFTLWLQAIRAATGQERWDRAVGDAWHPRA